MPDLETEIQNTLHPKPKAGSLGRSELDNLIAFAESRIEAARSEIAATQPEEYGDSGKAHAYERMRRTAQQARFDVDQQTLAIQQSIALTTDYGQKLLVSSNPRPQNTPEEVIDRRWQSYHELLDATPAKDLLTRIYQELQVTAKVYGGDPLGTYLLRGGEGLINRFLETKKVPPTSYYNTLLLTANPIESDLRSACETLIMIAAVEAAFPGVQKNLYSNLNALDKLVSSKAILWEQSASGVKVQSQQDGSINVRFGSLEEFRAWCRTPRGA